ncbi:hypothetical protein PKHYL_00280 [Psychrobacter sp. KH172YL61]|nr:hypothetical protein PKHYL_00280 [Psychrobacter sp. KH172YL61]
MIAMRKGRFCGVTEAVGKDKGGIIFPMAALIHHRYGRRCYVVVIENKGKSQDKNMRKIKVK